MKIPSPPSQLTTLNCHFHEASIIAKLKVGNDGLNMNDLQIRWFR